MDHKQYIVEGRRHIEAMNSALQQAIFSKEDPVKVFLATAKKVSAIADQLKASAAIADRLKKQQEKRERALLRGAQNGKQGAPGGKFVSHGDSSMLRLAMHDAGIPFGRMDRIYSETRKGGKRRIKLWNATTVMEATDLQREKLDDRLRELFGDRYIELEYINGDAGARRFPACVVWVKAVSAAKLH